MRVRVRFRYNSETGEVETFVVEDIGGAHPAADHDAVHNAITTEVANVVERNAEFDELQGGPLVERPPVTESPTVERTSEPATPEREVRPVGE